MEKKEKTMLLGVVPLAAAAAQLGVSVWRVRRAMKAGFLKGWSGGEGRRFRYCTQASLFEFILRNGLALWRQGRVDESKALARVRGEPWIGNTIRYVRVPVPYNEYAPAYCRLPNHGSRL